MHAKIDNVKTFYIFHVYMANACAVHIHFLRFGFGLVLWCYFCCRRMPSLILCLSSSFIHSVSIRVPISFILPILRSVFPLKLHHRLIQLLVCRCLSLCVCVFVCVRCMLFRVTSKTISFSYPLWNLKDIVFVPRFQLILVIVRSLLTTPITFGFDSCTTLPDSPLCIVTECLAHSAYIITSNMILYFGTQKRMKKQLRRGKKATTEKRRQSEREREGEKRRRNQTR